MSELVHIPQHKLPAPGGRAIVREAGLCLALFDMDGKLYAIDDSCPHDGGSLVMGMLEGMQVRCPAHGLKFDIRSGCMASGGLSVRSYPVTVVDGQTFVSLQQIPE
ncbi:MAG: Rieske 2Fe-2S domain-containing protein [Xanthomonadaceae bacterium]|nr:Rieske 2Fe-2S domain-containing protein [Xanthomonadaceae bacterium]